MEPVMAACAQGRLRGVRQDGAVLFRAIPFAAPPVGPARFAPPAPPAAWAGIRPADQHGPIAPQGPSRLRAAMGDFERPQDEDCLTLTLATPEPDGRARPVIFWVHGGAYLSGAGSLDWYQGAALASAADAVVVAPNYRLGALGFLHHPDLGPPNPGLLDMCAALRWVGENIAAFGGDPGNVTLMGQSAGGHAIQMLLALDLAPGLFHRAILQSPPAGLLPLPVAAAAERAANLARLAGCASVAGLRALPVAALLDAQQALGREMAAANGLMPPLGPVADGFADMAGFHAASIATAAARGIPLLLGSVAEERHAFAIADPAMVALDAAGVAAAWARLPPAAGEMAQWRARRPDGAPWEWLADALTMLEFAAPLRALAGAADDAGVTAYLYRFDWAPAGSPIRAGHCVELPFIFGPWPHWRTAPMLAGGDPAEMAALTRLMQTAWGGFARTGSPDSPALPWPAWHRDAPACLLIDRAPRLEQAL